MSFLYLNYIPNINNSYILYELIQIPHDIFPTSHPIKKTI